MEHRTALPQAAGRVALGLAAVLLLCAVIGFLQWRSRVRHIQAGVGLSGLRLDIL